MSTVDVSTIIRLFNLDLRAEKKLVRTLRALWLTTIKAHRLNQWSCNCQQTYGPHSLYRLAFLLVMSSNTKVDKIKPSIATSCDTLLCQEKSLTGGLNDHQFLSMVDELDRQLRLAVTCGDSEHVHKLLRLPRHPPVDFNQDPPPICLAAAKGHVDIVGLSNRHGADVNVRSTEDSIPLICAADNGYWNVLALLINAGAMMNLLNRNGETALARATRRGWVQCARLLLTYGANPHPMATDGHPLVVSPLHLARQMHQTAIEKDILTRAISMENIMLQVVKATLPKHILLVELGHLVDTKVIPRSAIISIHAATE
ncbi:uncharacterized protein DEA37_0015243 [Paragonimus westermani]|uniref:Uncharacterized protein n=1 Tax=Paragonimus westermani TaxID=34504 RepID=A0A5J4NN36_9TREM|nr:uncharacterized protein DEA37_0015243 [Paragonimus westermani]